MRLKTGLGGTRSLVDASPEWWEEKIRENKDYAKFRNRDLSIFDEKYAILFQDSVTVGDQTMTPLQFQNNSNQNEENMEGKGDNDEINLDDDEPLFTSLHESSSRETIHRHFHTVLEAMLKLSDDIIKPDANYNDHVPKYILNNPRYYPMFKDCIGAIDGTHVRASVPQKDEVKYIGRKGYATQNIMDVCDFNMCFTFVWAGWEGTAHDTRIFNEALQRPDLNFPYPTGDKYYVVDAGYPNTRGYLAPYKGSNIRYHLPNFRRGHTTAIREPRGPKEKFNYLHSSLRNIIERTFGV
ncbi:unnamed protein product [Lactuca saligna]|uniref:DDE Tnp4 domain-containing protein n=1 Tax=Lactuca saligna TaxID=75948 RepID=A0AA35URH3_LACSI|nr:unnamed protein product [Lactuca saligna]